MRSEPLPRKPIEEPEAAGAPSHGVADRTDSPAAAAPSMPTVAAGRYVATRTCYIAGRSCVRGAEVNHLTDEQIAAELDRGTIKEA